MPVWLAVEDEADISEFLLGMFEVWGLSGIAFDNGREAIEWLDKVDSGLVKTELPELALIDVRLPSASGIEVAARIRRSTKLGHIAVALMTAYRLEQNAINQFLAQSGADVFIYKPLPDMQEFRQYLNNLLESKKLKAPSKT